MMQIQSAFVALGTDLFTEVVAFYQQFLGQQPEVYQPNRYAEFHFPGLKLGIFAPHMDHQAEFAHSQNSGLSLCLEVKELETAIASLISLGYTQELKIQEASHGREVYVYDPAGNRLILHQR